MNTYAVIDLETTGNAPGRGDEIIEIGIVIMRGMEVIEEFSTFVYPESTIPSFVSRLTGITDEDVVDAPLLTEVVPEMKRLLRQDYVVAHNIDFDLNFVNESLLRLGESPLDVKVIDTVELSRILLPAAPGHRLSDLADFLSLSHNQPHRAISDALVTADLWRMLYSKLKELPERTLLYLEKLEPSLKSDIKSMMREWILEKRYSFDSGRDYEMWEGIPVRPVSTFHGEKDVEKETPGWEQWKSFFFEDGAGLERVLPSYVQRTEQKQMAESIHQSFGKGGAAFIEAGAGVGKSMASVVTAVHTALSERERVLISTYTNALQAQLMDKELPQLKQVSPVSFTYASLKGSDHYLSLAHFRYELEYGSLENYDDVLTKAILLIWVLETDTGDVGEIQLPSNGYKFWRKVSADQKGKELSLKMGTYSYYHLAYERARQADIVVTTHALFCFDLLEEDEFIPACRYAIIDEAHHLNRVASKYFGSRLYHPSVQQLFSQWRELFEPYYYRKMLQGEEQIRPLIQMCHTHLDAAKSEWSELSSYIATYIVKQRIGAASDTGKVMFDFRQHASKKFHQTVREMCERLEHQIGQLIRQTETIMNEIMMQLQVNEDADLSVFLTRLDYQKGHYREFVTSLQEAFLRNNLNPVWAELDVKHPQGSLSIEMESYDSSELLANRLFDKKESIIFTSATLAARGSFDFISKSLGVSGEYRGEIIPSPFDYERQMKVVVPTDIPHIKKESEQFLYAVSELILSIAEKTEGRMLILFTSYAMLKDVYYLLKEFQEFDRYQLIAQGVTSGSRDRLKKDFQSMEHSILLGTNTFWEGIDIPGDDLSCLVMVRLPFEPPAHPAQLIEEKRWGGAGGNPFMDVTLPKAILRFKQGIGRLIRSETDRGMLVILDRRMMEAGYGKYFQEALPTSEILQYSVRELLDNMEELLPIDGDERND